MKTPSVTAGTFDGGVAPDAAVVAELALARADDESAGESRPAAGRVDYRRSGEILEAHGVEPSATRMSTRR